MAGADGFNAQGVKRAKEIRSCFTLADDGFVLSGGDYEAQEVSIMDAAYRDPVLHEELLQTEPCRDCGGEGCGECKGTGKTKLKIHALWGMSFFEGKTYDQIMESKGSANSWDDIYTRSKNGVFAICYFGEGYTLKNRVGIPQEIADKSFEGLLKRYPTFNERRKVVIDKFCSMKQPDGIGTVVEWHKPDDYIESIFGFKRYFTLENSICKVLYDLAQDIPDSWSDIQIKVVRRDREQTASGAVQSALYAAAFALQSANMRAAGNHVIQSTGAEVTKMHQRRIYDLQPYGINEWRVLPMNIHDEIMAATRPQYVKDLVRVKDEVIAEIRPTIPLIAIDWSEKLETWADK
jgi:DNA polymerase I-like protein with 3'-5' exonuclease and polymerase domains